ncbi:MAG: ADP-ribosylglycohydrolase family protein [Anaerolineales bacterium]|nr:ADP-ribosylglycohydrolase family protein [Anaerolineales bacterium]
MIGAIAGDIIGSVYEYHNIKTTKFPLFDPNCFFTDDSVLTIALADAIMNQCSYETTMKEYYARYPDAGFGCFFHQWAQSHPSKPYHSWGNGAAMRISPVGFVYSSLDEVLAHAIEYTEITHNHPEGIKGAQATAAAIYLARTGKTKTEIKEYVTKSFGYDLSLTCDEIRPTYRFDESCQGTVPQAITAFLEADDYESAVRLAISLGGDSDTLACITGGMAQAFYGGVPANIAEKVLKILDDDLRQVTIQFMEKYCNG